jgi:hypothetical protein
MALYSELPVYKATYDLFLGIFQFTKNFGKEYKYTVANRTKGNFFNAIEKQNKVVRDKHTVWSMFTYGKLQMLNNAVSSIKQTIV